MNALSANPVDGVLERHRLRSGTRLSMVDSELLGSDQIMSDTRRLILRVLGYGCAGSLILIPLGVLFVPVVALAALGFQGSVVASSVLWAHATGRWLLSWCAGAAAVLWNVATVAWWWLWGIAFDYADVNSAVPFAVDVWSAVALVVGILSFAGFGLVAILTWFRVRSGMLENMDGGIRRAG